MAALGVDLVSSLAGVGKVITGATGELVLWQGLPGGHQHNWRCSHIRYEHVR
jgi:protocatechuate 3,4-dioxygenase beta subunit